MADAEMADVVSTAKDGIDSAHAAIDLYNKMVNMLIPWGTFEQTMNELRQSKKEYSDKAAEMVGRIQTLLLNSADQYRSSKEEVSRWCKMAIPVLGQYMSLFERTTDSKVAEAQKVLLLKVLNDGSAHVSNAMEKLEASRASFNSAYGELTTLKTQLDNDFNEGSAYYDSSVSKLRREAYAGAVAGAIGGPIGLAIAYSIAAGVVEGELIPNLKKAFKETKEQFDRLHEIVKKAQDSIDSAKGSITEELRVLGTMSAKIEETKTFAETWAVIPSVLFADLKKSATELIDMCNQYIDASE